jgi:uncharacterized protein (DUF111 family)
MKKGRGAAATTLSALCTATTKNAVLVALFQDSTSIGARVTTVERHALKRQVTIKSDKQMLYHRNIIFVY